jgi:hypothetical protein
MQRLRTRTLISTIAVAISFAALGVEAIRRYQLNDHQQVDHLPRSGRRMDTFPRSGAVLSPLLPPKVASGLVPPPLGEPFEVPIPPFPNDHWGTYDQAASGILVYPRRTEDPRG